MKHRTVTLRPNDPLPLHLVEAGPEDAPLVLLLHGFPDTWHCWEAQIAHLAKRFHVVAPDQRGYNLSGRPRGVRSYCIDELAGDVLALIDHYGQKTAAVVGHDWGAALTWHLAMTAPERIRQCVPMNVPHPQVLKRFLKTDKVQRKRSSYMLFFQLPWLPEFLLRRNDFAKLELSLRLGSMPGSFSDEDFRLYKQAWAQPGALTAMLSWYRAALRYPPKTPSDKRVRIPTRIIWGERDPFLRAEMAAASRELCDHGDLQLVSGASHWVQKDRPAEVCRLLDEFLV
jgi:pimeloyl-ACP methyl ester carboxylesterase